MSKSYGNHIGITEPPGGDVRQDAADPGRAARVLVRAAARRARSPADVGPRDAKRALARALVERFWGAEAAAEAEAGFDRVFIAHELPEEIEEVVARGQRRDRCICPR